jgi:hypothetical protein
VSARRRYSKETLEAWKVIAIGAIAALCIASGLLMPIVQSSYFYQPLRFYAGLALSLLATGWCIADAKIERYDIDQDSPPIGTLLYWVPVVGVIYYFVRLRGLRGSAPLVGKALLFTLLMGALFITARQFSGNVLSNL